ncbi:unnamed protein product [Mesocestoides corti]|uniref:Uncharacterized protein n=3 Tax=Mesocestoides corti TaxID=53468 RepID=A0A0R3UHW1_MESCO|nr:unnamed protein product [Mesocestoides corti]
MSTTADRKAELELKKEKLRALREEKLRREELKLRGLGGIDSAPASSTDLRGEANALLRNLGIDPLKSPEVGEIGPHLPRRVDNGTRSRTSLREFCFVMHSGEFGHSTVAFHAGAGGQAAKAEMRVGATTESCRLPCPHNHDDLWHRKPPRMMQQACLPVDVGIPPHFICILPPSAHPARRARSPTSNGSSRLRRSEDLLPCVVDLYAERWSTSRTVVDLDWSPTYPELVLAAYSANEEATDEPAGCCMVWNLKFPTRGCPEYLFHCNEPITAAAMVRFHPNLVIGGTYSGQVVLWDSRSNKRTPVQRSTFTTMTHTQPINSVQVIGSQNAHNAITLSSDGTMCSWSLDNLGAPRERIRVCETPSTPTGMFDLFPTCMDFFAGDQNNFVVGTEVGHIYTDQRHSSRTVPLEGRSIRRPQPFSGHSTMVSGIATHPSPSAISFSHIFLSSSLDWTVRLWSVRDNTPLHTFDDYSECVYGVDWSPLHPALFAAVDGTGRIDVWNLIDDIEVPTARCRTQFTSAMNKVKWDTTGSFLAAGDDEGHVHVCAVAEPLASPGPEDAARLAHVLAGLKATSSSANQTVFP